MLLKCLFNKIAKKREHIYTIAIILRERLNATMYIFETFVFLNSIFTNENT